MIRRRTIEELPIGRAKVTMVRQMFDEIAPRYELLNTIMTLGLDRGWRRKTVDALRLEHTSIVADIASGTGDLADELSKHGHRAVGIDLSIGMLEQARKRGLVVVQGDATDIPVTTCSLDGVVCGFALRNFADPDAVFVAIARALRPGGRVVILEVDTPQPAFLRIGHRIWLGHVVPLLGALFGHAAAYRYLPRSLAYLPSDATLSSMLTHAGFSDIEKVPLSFGISQLVVATRNFASVPS